MERLEKLLKDKTNDLFELKQNDVLMRQDLSTYQAFLEENLKITTKVQNLKKTIEVRMDRVQAQEIKKSDGLVTDLAGLCQKLN